MKTGSVHQKVSHHVNTPAAQRLSAGPDGAAIEPPNHTGLPDNLKAGAESLSGLSLDDVRVHYNSPKPAQLQALAYTQGTDIHVAPGQEHHIPHEAWHVVQQIQGRVQPTTRVAAMPVNDNPALENEASVMGGKAMQMPHLAKTMPEARKSMKISTLQRMEAGTIQLATCKYCGWEGSHQLWCTPQYRAMKQKEESEEKKAQSDQSMDSRTRRDQKHPHHGDKNIKKAWK
jgi:hypothetical protein